MYNRCPFIGPIILAMSCLWYPGFVALSVEQPQKLKTTIIDRDRTVDTDIKVAKGERLLILPGVTLRFEKGAGILCEGRLEAVGAEGKLIRFTAKDKKKGWANIALFGEATQGSRLQWCRFEHGRGRGFQFSREGKFEKILTGKDEKGLVCGGGLFLYAVGKGVGVSNCGFQHNQAYRGGALMCWAGSSPEIKESLFVGNQAGEDAGAIHCVGRSSPDILYNYFSENRAVYGGAIHCLSWSSPRIEGNYIARNKAGSQAAISTFHLCEPRIIGNYIAENEAERDGGSIGAIVGSKPVLLRNYLGENKDASGTGKGYFAHPGNEDKKWPPSQCEEQEPQSKAAVWAALKLKGVLALPDGPLAEPGTGDSKKSGPETGKAAK